MSSSAVSARRLWTLLVSACLGMQLMLLLTRVGPVQASDKAENTPSASLADADLAAAAAQQAERFKQGESIEFKADNRRIFSILSKFVYSNQDVFLRELLSNASDALSKLRHEALKDKSLMKGKQELSIRVQADPANNRLIVTDTGIGMTKEELIDHLGTIAKSGTAIFDAQNKEELDNLIGQFGIGFYSVFLAAESVVVTSKSARSNKQHSWFCSNDSSFTVLEDEIQEGAPEDLVHGTRIILNLKEDAKEYTQTDKIESLIRKHSESIDFPIYLWKENKYTDEVTDEEEQAEEEKETTDAENAEEEKPKQKKTKKVDRKVWEWTLINTRKPIWMQDPKTVTDEQYTQHYVKLTKDIKLLAHSHFNIDGQIRLKGILYCPGSGRFDPLDAEHTAKVRGLSLYVKRVFITDEYKELLPSYLGFIRGVIDSDDLTLNISRERLQDTRVMKAIGKQLLSKTLAMLKGMAKDEEKYKTFWDLFGRAIKHGVRTDTDNKNKLVDLLRFDSSLKAAGQLTSLQEYVDASKDKQKEIYYLTGNTVEECKKSPYVEAVLARGYPVLYLVDPHDQSVIQSLTDYQDRKFKNLGEGDFRFADESIIDRKDFDQQQIKFKPVCNWFAKMVEDEVDSVKLSSRLTTSPCIVVSKAQGLSGHMLKLMASQRTPGEENPYITFLTGLKKGFELNHKHPAIIALNDRLSSGETLDGDFVDMAKLMFDSALISSGFEHKNPSNLLSLVDKILRKSLSVDEDAKPEVDLKPAADLANVPDLAPEASAEETSFNINDYSSPIDFGDQEQKESDAEENAERPVAATQEHQHTEQCDSEQCSAHGHAHADEAPMKAKMQGSANTDDSDNESVRTEDTSNNDADQKREIISNDEL